MIIKSIQVENFRSISCETLELNRLTALVGSNGSGKSSFLHAIELFYAEKPQIQNDDFYNKNTDKDIIFTVIFTNLSDDAKNQFQEYYDKKTKELIIKRKCEFNDDKLTYIYYGNILRNLDFKEIGKQSKAEDIKTEYTELKKDEKYKSFPNHSTKANIIEHLSKYEKEHPDECERCEEKICFESDVSEYLKKYVKLLVIPAVRDASLDATEEKNSLLKELVYTVVKKVLLEKDSVKEFRKKFQEGFDTLNKDNKQELDNLSESLTKTLGRYVNNARIKLLWDPLHNFEIPLPQIIARLAEDGYTSTVDRTGHGLQRVFIMTLLEHLSNINDNADEPTSTWMFLIDEPELYQHPNRQRHLSEIYDKLSKREGSLKTQIIYSTHSPHFIGLNKINDIRLLRKDNNQSPKTTTISYTSTAKISESLTDLRDSKYPEDKLKSQFHSIENSLINEGFFSKIVVLVEGNVDREAIAQTARNLEISLNQKDISIIPGFSVNNLDTCTIMFKHLNIPVYMIWDSDIDLNNDSNFIKDRNSKYLELCETNKIVNDDYLSDIAKDHAVIHINFESMLENRIDKELGKNEYKKMLIFYKKKYPGKGNTEKKAIVIRDMLEYLYEKHKIIPKELKDIVEKIVELSKNS